MNVLVTGGAGFLGTRVVRALLADATPPARIVVLDRTASPVDDPRVDSRIGSITDASCLADVFTSGIDAVWHLAATLSGQSEREPELAMEVNIGGTLALIDACRALSRPPRFVFASTIAVFGGPLPADVPDDFPTRPQTTYGVTKAICELHVAEASRRGVIDGLAVRVPTVAIRPGAPNSAVSGFVSGIVREPVNGLDVVCPVPLDTRLWVSSPSTTTANLVHAGRIDTQSLGGVRVLDLPGITVTPAALLDSLERLAGADVRARVRVEPDADVTRVMTGWPGGFVAARAAALGFRGDASAEGMVAEYLAEVGRG